MSSFYRVSPDGNFELHPGRDDNGPEGEGVGADGRDHNGGDGRMDHAGTGRHGVRRAPRRGRHDQAVTLQQSCLKGYLHRYYTM